MKGEEYEKHDWFEHSEQAQDGRAYPGAASRAFGRVAPDGDEVGDGRFDARLGQSVPDLANAGELAEALDVSLDALVGYDPHGTMLPMPPRGKHLFGTVTVGERWQIVIPKQARELFGIEAGDALLVLGDEEQGLAILKADEFMDRVSMLRSMVDR